MAAKSEGCDEKPLQYSLGCGVLEKGDVANVLPPGILPGVVPVMMDDQIASEWSSGFKPIVQGTMGSTLNRLLPPAVCEGGLCKGELPGCKPQAVSPINIPKVSFKLSRQVRIDELVKPEMRRAVAYGLAVLPSSIEIGEDYVHKKENSYLSQKDRRLGGVVETSNLVVRVNEPMVYRLDHALMNKLVSMGAFSLLSDGRENTHGPVSIVSVELQAPAGGGAEALDASSDARAGGGHHPLFTNIALGGGAAALLAWTVLAIVRPPHVLWSVASRRSYSAVNAIRPPCGDLA